MKKYKTLYADPPWYEIGGGKIKRGADRHYPLMKTKNIIALGPKIQQIMDINSHLYLWCTNNFLKDALEVMKSWGYEYKTMITWIKGHVENTLFSKENYVTIKFDTIGLGQYFRGMTEHCLFGVRGNIPYKIIDGKRQQGKTMVIASKKEHSKKPKEIRKMVEKVSYPLFIELFSRNKVEGWTTLGNELSGYNINKELEDLINGINM